MKIVSACLAGVNCKYSGGSNRCQKMVDLVKSGEAIPVCPEQLGGLATPRDSAENINGKIITNKGEDVTSQYSKGAEEGLRIAKMIGCKEVFLKTKSPACGAGKIYDGTFSGKLVPGDGFFAKALKDNGIKVIAMDKDWWQE